MKYSTCTCLGGWKQDSSRSLEFSVKEFNRLLITSFLSDGLSYPEEVATPVKTTCILKHWPPSSASQHSSRVNGFSVQKQQKAGWGRVQQHSQALLSHRATSEQCDNVKGGRQTAYSAHRSGNKTIKALMSLALFADSELKFFRGQTWLSCQPGDVCEANFLRQMGMTEPQVRSTSGMSLIVVVRRLALALAPILSQTAKQADVTRARCWKLISNKACLIINSFVLTNSRISNPARFSPS